MAVVIRMARFGAKHDARYRITVGDSRRYPTAKHLEVIGFYNPNASGQEKKFEVNLAQAKYWISKGAQPTDRVKYVLKLAGYTK